MVAAWARAWVLREVANGALYTGEPLGADGETRAGTRIVTGLLRVARASFPGRPNTGGQLRPLFGCEFATMRALADGARSPVHCSQSKSCGRGGDDDALLEQRAHLALLGTHLRHGLIVIVLIGHPILGVGGPFLPCQRWRRVGAHR